MLKFGVGETEGVMLKVGVGVTSATEFMVIFAGIVLLNTFSLNESINPIDLI